MSEPEIVPIRRRTYDEAMLHLVLLLSELKEQVHTQQKRIAELEAKLTVYQKSP
jgi:hypothetical protein